VEDHGRDNGYYSRLIEQEKRATKPQPDPLIGPGGGPTRATTLPEDSDERKKFPIASGVLDYFPDAIVEVSRVSWQGNEQHNPGQPLHWARGKSMNQDDTMMRHFMQRGTRDSDGQRHRAKVAWRALAALQIEIEEERAGKAPEPDHDDPRGKLLLMRAPKKIA
jgi:hypothetical protein